MPDSPELGNNHQSTLTLKRPVRRKGGPEEELRFQYRQNDKDVRQTIVRVTRTHLQKKAAHSWSICDFDFTGSHIEEPSFDNSIFLGKTTWFGGATFSGKEAWFRGVDFGVGEVSFERSRVWSSAPAFD